MPLKKNSPGCKCCVIPCVDWPDDPPEEIQLTLPAGCERSGTHVLDRDDSASFTLDCPSTTLDATATGGCAVWVLRIGSGSSQDSIWVTVSTTASGATLIRTGVCNDGGSSSGTDAGTVYAAIVELSAWSDLDGLSVPFNNRQTDTEGMSDCSTDDDSVISFVP